MRVACQLAEGSGAVRREQPFGSESRAGSVHDERGVPRELASMLRAGGGRGERLPLQVNPRQVNSSKPYGGLPFASGYTPSNSAVNHSQFVQATCNCNHRLRQFWRVEGDWSRRLATKELVFQEHSYQPSGLARLSLVPTTPSPWAAAQPARRPRPRSDSRPRTRPHLEYAGTWFGIAATLLLIWGAHGWQRAQPLKARSGSEEGAPR